VAMVAVACAVASVPARAWGDGPGSPAAREDAVRRAAAALELAAQEYRHAFQGEAMTAPAEAQEAAGFVGEARRAASSLAGDEGRALDGRLAEVAALIARAAPPDTVAAHTAAALAWMRTSLGVSLEVRPARAPVLAEGDHLYGQQCAQCHGPRGYGDGPAAAGLVPPPARLADPAVLAAATPLEVYRRITLGVPGTAMPSFSAALTPEQRWALTLKVVALADSLAARVPDGDRALALATARANLRGALERAADGDRAGAEAKAADAYMAFEGLETVLRATQPSLVADAEGAFARFREGAASGVAAAELRARHARVESLLARAADALAAHPSGSGLFAESFLLLLREGLEAILILGVIVAVVARSGAGERKREVRWGAGLAVAASLATAALLHWLIRIAPAQQEALEGAVMLLAAAVLFYVSYWMVSKLDQRTWQRFVRQRIEGALAGGGALALAAAAFLAVYREGFETVLFYQALYGTGGAAGAAPITAGLVSAGAALVVVFVAIERFGLRIPLKPFFAVTGALLYFMAFVFAGRGVTELQEGAWVGVTPVRGIPSSDFLGIHPTLESLAAQGVLVAALLVALGWALLAARARRRAEAPLPVASPRGPRLTMARQLPRGEAAWRTRGSAPDRIRPTRPGDAAPLDHEEHVAAD